MERKDLVIVKCSYCGNEKKKRRSFLQRYEKSYCSQKCQNEAKKTGRYVECRFCKKRVWRTESQLKKSRNVFCNRSCATSYNNAKHKKGKNHPNYIDGMSRYRINALSFYGKKCSNTNCDITKAKIEIKEEMLDVHHKDGNRENNDIDNLEVLCIWCHAKHTRKI